MGSVANLILIHGYSQTLASSDAPITDLRQIILSNEKIDTETVSVTSLGENIRTV